MNTNETINDISQINTGDMSTPAQRVTFMSYIYSWGFIMWIFWTIVAGSVLLWQFSHYFRPNNGYHNGKYQRGKIDDTNYIALAVASVVIGLFLTILTMWLYSMSRSKTEM